MKPDTDTIYDAARDAVDEDDVARVLELAAEEEAVNDEAIAALTEVTVDTVVADALAAAAVAGWRGRIPTGDDVGHAAEQRRSCCENGPGGPAPIPTSLKAVW